MLCHRRNASRCSTKPRTSNFYCINFFFRYHTYHLIINIFHIFSNKKIVAQLQQVIEKDEPKPSNPNTPSETVTNPVDEYIEDSSVNANVNFQQATPPATTSTPEGLTHRTTQNTL